ncbi:unnamed protein product [Hermetia illucens]|uniref:Lipid droplet-associated hydrolase n=2 Tax=Hermetia illucens TaxID=343691 RepID=A0A7R8YX46_HERIL|nr:unnamed protein product [Hermetia illucens]
MQEAFVNINEIPTHVMTWGKWIEESFADHEREVVICITGNPGLPGFYTQFLSTLHNNLDAKTPVWVIGHAGHDEPSASSVRKVPPLSGNESKFELNAQLKHKIEFIETYVPAHVKIHLIGHSIGAWMILQLLKESRIKDRLQKCYLLFPTVERMAVSPNGVVFTKLVLPVFFAVRMLAKFVNCLPISLRVLMISAYFWITSTPRFFLGTTLKYLRPTILDCVVHLAKEEMERVTDLEVDIVQDNVDLLKFYYGTTDGWVPVKYYDEIKVRVPGIDAELDEFRISHSFVLREAVPMGEIVADWIKRYSVKAS